MSARLRVLVRGDGDRAKRRIGRLNVYREALASWYGPGFYGRRTGCGGTLGYSQLGVAHKTLPCGTKVTLRHNGRRVRVPVIDRGPYVGAREYDLTAATARKLRFRGHGGILTTQVTLAQGPGSRAGFAQRAKPVSRVVMHRGTWSARLRPCGPGRRRPRA